MIALYPRLELTLTLTLTQILISSLIRIRIPTRILTRILAVFVSQVTTIEAIVVIQYFNKNGAIWLSFCKCKTSDFRCDTQISCGLGNLIAQMVSFWHSWLRDG